MSTDEPMRPRKSIPRSGPPNRRNAARQKRERERTNGSPERDAFVRSLPCCACGVVGYSEVAHVGKEGKGAGRKANADQTAPLCGLRPTELGLIYVGCHRQSHQRGNAWIEARYSVSLAACAAATEQAWLRVADGGV